MTATPVLWGLVRSGWRPRLRVNASGAGRRATLVLVGAASVAAPQLLFVIGMVAAAKLGTGAPTTFSYGFLGTQVFVSVLAGSVSIVAAAPIAAGWDRDPASLSGSIERGFRLAVLVLVPGVAAVALIGSDVAAPLLSGFGSSDISAVIRAFLALSPSILAAQATAIPLVALYALHRHAQIAGLVVGVAILQVGLSAGAVAVGGIVALGLATSISLLAFAGGIYALLYGRLAIREMGRRVVDLARVGHTIRGMLRHSGDPRSGGRARLADRAGGSRSDHSLYRTSNGRSATRSRQSPPFLHPTAAVIGRSAIANAWAGSVNAPRATQRPKTTY